MLPKLSSVYKVPRSADEARPTLGRELRTSDTEVRVYRCEGLLLVSLDGEVRELGQRSRLETGVALAVNHARLRGSLPMSPTHC